MKSTKYRVEENKEASFDRPGIVREVKFLYAKVKNSEVKKFAKEIMQSNFYTRIIFERNERRFHKEGYKLFFIFQPTKEVSQLIEGQEVFRRIEKKKIGEYAEYGFVSLKNMKAKLISISQNECDIQRQRASMKIMNVLSIKEQEGMKGFWDSYFWNKYASRMSENAMPLEEIQKNIEEYMAEVDMSTEGIAWRSFNSYCQQHSATAS